MGKRLFTLVAFLAFFNAKSQTSYFPPVFGNTWDTVSPASLGWCQDQIDTLIDYLGNRNTKAFIILKDGKIALEKYYGTFTQDSAWYWASAGKTLTAFTVGIAQQEGYLSINDTTSHYLTSGWTSCPALKEDLITIKHQLTMTSGLDDGVPDYTCTVDTCLQYLADAGTRWAYHNGPYTLLDDVIQSATGQSLNSYISQNIGSQTGIIGSYFPSGYNNVFFSKARSMARFGLLVLNKGIWNNNAILTDTAYFNQMVNTSQLLNPSYGYLWWLNGKTSFMFPTLQTVFPGSLNPSAPDDMFAAIGKNGQLINIVPSQNLVFIRMGNSPGTGGAVPIAFNDTIWQKLNSIFCNSSGISDAQIDESDLKIYPNPALEMVTMELPKQFFDVQITDLAGRIIFENKDIWQKSEIDIRNFGKGIYLARVIANNKGTYTKKIVILR